MPNRLPSPCAERGCPALSLTSRCERHEQQRQQRNNEATRVRRGSSTAQGYGAIWRRLRLLVLAEEPLCRDPFGLHEGRTVAATDVDHIDGDNRNGDRANLQGLCHACHSVKTNREQGGGWPRARRGRAGQK